MKQFFTTIGFLISKPGFLSLEYKQGKRDLYVQPIVLFFIVCSIFFAVFYFFFKEQHLMLNFPKPGKALIDSTKQRLKAARSTANSSEDSAGIEEALHALNDTSTGKNIRKDEFYDKDDELVVNLGFLQALDTSFKSVAAYDSSQLRLPVAERDAKSLNVFKRVGYRLTELYGHDKEKFWTDILDRFLHFMPYILIACLPVYILLLKLFYIRRRDFGLSKHSVFLLHIYSLTFLLFLVFLGIISLRHLTEQGRIWFTAFAAFVYLLIYLFRAMRRFYQQRAGKTFVNFFFFNLFCSILLFAVFIVCFGISLFRV